MVKANHRLEVNLKLVICTNYSIFLQQQQKIASYFFVKIWYKKYLGFL